MGLEDENATADVTGRISQLLGLEPIGASAFRGSQPTDRTRSVAGGLLVAQALGAAGLTVDPAQRPHSFHAYFLRPADPDMAVDYRVDLLHDGRSFARRQVLGEQLGRAVLTLSASFHVSEGGLDHGPTMPPAPEPETLPSVARRTAVHNEAMGGGLTLDVRRADGDEGHQGLWIKTVDSLPDDALVHSYLLAYASDLALLDAILSPHGLTWSDPGVDGASLDHAVWFHRPFRIDQWLLYDQHSPSAFGGRGLALGRLFDRHGAHVASVAQEGLVRRVDPATGEGFTP